MQSLFVSYSDNGSPLVWLPEDSAALATESKLAANAGFPIICRCFVGAWSVGAAQVRAAYRDYDGRIPSNGRDVFGFRLVRTLFDDD